MRKMFLSHVKLAVAGGVAFSPKQVEEWSNISEALGYVYVDRRNHRLCIKFESTYLELDPELARAWVKLTEEPPES